MAIAIGERVTAASVNEEIQAPTSALPLGVVPNGLGQRTSDKVGIAGETSVMRLDNIQMYAGRSYRVSSPRNRFDSVTATDRFLARIRYATGGAPVATTASTALCRSETDDACTGSMFAFIHSSSTTLLSVLLTGTRVVGAGATTMMGSDEGGIELIVEDMGLTQANTAVIL